MLDVCVSGPYQRIIMEKTSKEAEEAQTETSFEDILERLEQIAGSLETGEPKLEEALELFEEGVSLTKEGTRRLDKAERKIEVLLDDGQTMPLEQSV